MAVGFGKMSAAVSLAPHAPLTRDLTRLPLKGGSVFSIESGKLVVKEEGILCTSRE